MLPKIRGNFNFAVIVLHFPISIYFIKDNVSFIFLPLSSVRLKAYENQIRDVWPVEA